MKLKKIGETKYMLAFDAEADDAVVRAVYRGRTGEGWHFEVLTGEAPVATLERIIEAAHARWPGAFS